MVASHVVVVDSGILLAEILPRESLYAQTRTIRHYWLVAVFLESKISKLVGCIR